MTLISDWHYSPSKKERIVLSVGFCWVLTYHMDCLARCAQDYRVPWSLSRTDIYAMALCCTHWNYAREITPGPKTLKRFFPKFDHGEHWILCKKDWTILVVALLQCVSGNSGPCWFLQHSSMFQSWVPFMQLARRFWLWNPGVLCLRAGAGSAEHFEIAEEWREQLWSFNWWENLKLSASKTVSSVLERPELSGPMLAAFVLSRVYMMGKRWCLVLLEAETPFGFWVSAWICGASIQNLVQAFFVQSEPYLNKCKDTALETWFCVSWWGQGECKTNKCVSSWPRLSIWGLFDWRSAQQNHHARLFLASEMSRQLHSLLQCRLVVKVKLTDRCFISNIFLQFSAIVFFTKEKLLQPTCLSMRNELDNLFVSDGSKFERKNLNTKMKHLILRCWSPKSLSVNNCNIWVLSSFLTALIESFVDCQEVKVSVLGIRNDRETNSTSNRISASVAAVKTLLVCPGKVILCPFLCSQHKKREIAYIVAGTKCCMKECWWCAFVFSSWCLETWPRKNSK